MIKNSTEAVYANIFKNKKYIIILIVIVFYVLIDSVKIGDNLLDFSFLYDLNLYFWGIFIQAFPFILSGALLSSVIQIFIGQDKLNAIGASGNSSPLYPLIAAFAMPTCDCSSVTIAAGFIKKNFPLKFVIIYLLAAPIINPIVIAATIFAFPGRLDFVLIRLVLGILTALIVANVMHGIYRGNTMSSYIQENYDAHKSCACGHCHDAFENESGSEMTFIFKLRAVLLNTGDELFHVLPFVIAGAFVSSTFQICIPREMLQGSSIYSGILLQTGIMLLTAFILSQCSTSDSFIARSFTGHFTAGPVLGFLILGPMIDIKNVIVLLSYFKKRFVAVLTLLIFAVVYLLIISISFLFKGLL